jgi:hypothetical protein
MAGAGGDGPAGHRGAGCSTRTGAGGTGTGAGDGVGSRAGDGGRPVADDRAFARSARFWLRAFPRRWRAVHLDEALAVLAELALPGARRVGAREAVAMVRSGWATRWRGHPGPMTWLAYRLLDLRVPSRYRGWAHDDITGVLYPVRLDGPVPVVVPIGGEVPVGAVAAPAPLGGPPTTLMA